MINYVNEKPFRTLADYDFLGSIYRNTKVSELAETFESIRIQTHKPNKIILVLDGDVEKKVLDLVDKYSPNKKNTFKK